MDFATEYNPEHDKKLVVRFYDEAVLNKTKSHEASRPIYDDVEMCEIVFPGDRTRTLIVPAHAEWKRFGTRRVTYAERFKDHYARFKANQAPVVEGTPLSEVTFLSKAQVASYKALDIYTVEQLASLSGQGIKNLGVGGLAVVQQAKAYLEQADATADATKLRIAQVRIEELEAQLREALKPVPLSEVEPNDPGYADWSDEKLKEHIKELTGSRPQGNPSHQTLVALAYQLEAETEPAAA